jgi:ABC-type spermidine/putrescine transport system permease subunit II
MVSASLYQFDCSLEEAALSLGATELNTLCKVTLPIVRPAILSSFLFAFIVSFDELIISSFISNINTITLPQKIWAGLRFEINPTIAAVSTLQIAIVAIFLILTSVLRKDGSR